MGTAPQAGVCRPARAATQLTLAPIPGCSLRFQEFPKTSGPRAGVQEGRVTTGSRAATADHDPTPGNQSHRKPGPSAPSGQSRNARHSGRLGRQRSGTRAPRPTADTRALPWEQLRPEPSCPLRSRDSACLGEGGVSDTLEGHTCPAHPSTCWVSPKRPGFRTE